MSPFRFKNTLIIANVISNIIGVTVVFYLARRAGMGRPELQSSSYASINLIFIPLSFVIPIVVTLFYERPIRRFFDLRESGMVASATLVNRAHQKLLNEPFFLIALNAFVWMAAAVAYPLYYWKLGMSRKTILGALSLNLQVGLVTVTVSFFVIEFFLQRRLAPYFFPLGGMSAVADTIRIRIRTRLIAFLTATNLIPMITLARGSWGITQSVADPGQALSALHVMIIGDAIIFAGIGIWLTFLVSSNLTRPLADMTAVLHRIRDGDFDSRVCLTSNDELGYVGDVVNEMAAGLKEREFIKETFGKYVSKEVRDEVLSRHIPLDGEFREVSVLFADLRNFTPLDDHATKALNAAMEMNRGLGKLNTAFSEQGYSPLQHGIGIHSGKVVAANIGSPSRLSYALIGDTVNIASRLQDANKRYGTSIIISGETRRHLSQDFPLRRLPETALKGKEEPVSLFGI